VSSGFDDANNTEIYHLFAFNNQLYASTWWKGVSPGGDLWRSPTGNSGDWTKVITDGLGVAGNDVVLASQVYNSQIYISFGRLRGRVYRSTTGDPDSWTMVNTLDFGGQFNYATAFAQFGAPIVKPSAPSLPSGQPYVGLPSGQLYVATSGSWYSSTSQTGSEIWKCSLCDGSDWTLAAANGFGSDRNAGGAALEVYHGRLFSSVANPYNGMEVWASADGATWNKLAMLGFGDYNNWWTGFADNGVAIVEDHLVMGTFNQVTGGEIWEFLENNYYLPIIMAPPPPVLKPAK